MSDLEFRVDATGIENAIKAADPRKAFVVITRFYDEATKYVRNEMRQRAPKIVAGRVKIKMDPYKPPKWALVGSVHPLAHIFEGGTGSQGAAGFRHGGRHFPPVDGPGGLMKTTGLPRPKAFAMARAIAEQGGLAPKPFVAPTATAVQGTVLRMGEEIAREELLK